jgi:hypothetical protein
MPVPRLDLTAPTSTPTWAPRDDRWLRRGPSSFAGRPGRPLLIGACPRSGTTLLRGMVNNHPDLAMPAETDFVLPLWRMRNRFGDLRSADNRRAVAEWIFLVDGHGGRRIRARDLQGRQPTRDEAIERLVAAPPTLGSMLAACFELYAESHGKSRWGDKRPAYAGYVGALLRLFPDAQFVNVVRDPRGAVASIMRLGWHRPRVALAAAIATWEASIQRVDAQAGRMRPDQLLDVRYEDLVADPADSLTAVCGYAGLRAGDAVEQMLTGDRTGTFRPGWHENLSRPVDPGLATTWTEALKPRQIAIVEQVTRPYMERFGYLPVADAGIVIPDDQVRMIEAERERRRRKWRNEDREELKRRLRRPRRPVAAVPPAGRP